MIFSLDHRLTAADIEDLAARGESEVLEYKAFFPGDSLASTLVAFANTHGGIVLIGINDDGVIRGVPHRVADKSLLSMQKTAASLFAGLPERIYSTGMTDVFGKTVLYCIVGEVPPGYGPIHSSAGELYVRAGTRTLVKPITSRNTPETERRPPSQKEFDPLKLFVAMSFRNEEEPALEDYYNAMRRAADKAEHAIHVYRMNEIDGGYEITQEILKKIDESDIVLADFTLQSRNVYLEFGYARGKGRQVIVTARRDTDPEFDVRTWKTYFYRNATELEAILPPALDAAAEKAAEDKRLADG